MERHVWEASNVQNQKIVKILDSIPEKYSILSTETLAAHLSHRSLLFTFFSMFKNAPLEEASKKPDLVIIDEIRMQTRERRQVEDFIANGYYPVLTSGFAKIFTRPNHDIPESVTTKWNELNNATAISYRKIARRWVRYVILIGSFSILIVLVTRQLFEENKIIFKSFT